MLCHSGRAHVPISCQGSSQRSLCAAFNCFFLEFLMWSLFIAANTMKLLTHWLGPSRALNTEYFLCSEHGVRSWGREWWNKVWSQFSRTSQVSKRSDRPLFSGHSRNLHIWSHNDLITCTKSVQGEANQVPGVQWGPPPVEELLAIDSLWERKSQISLRVWPLVFGLWSNRKPHIQEYMNSTN